MESHFPRSGGMPTPRARVRQNRPTKLKVKKQRDHILSPHRPGGRTEPPAERIYAAAVTFRVLRHSDAYAPKLLRCFDT
jgi:hypothetical protein